MRKIYICGCYTTKFGELWDKDLREISFEAAKGALSDSGLQSSDINSIYFANMNSSRFAGQDHLGAMLADQLSITKSPATKVESACASGSLAVRLAWLELQSPERKTILIVGAEKMTDVLPRSTTKALMGAADEEFEGYMGITFPSLYAMIAREHMRIFNTKREELALCSIKNHYNGSLNPIAHFQNQVTLTQVLNSPSIADPLTLLDCSPMSDGGCAIILSNFIKSSVTIPAIEQYHDSIALHNRKNYFELKATKEATRIALHKSDLKINQIDVAEVHDCFSIAEIIAYEDIGFATKGRGAELIRSDQTQLQGSIPINSSGGLKACGHPIGATGIKQIAEIRNQLLGRCEKRQIQKNMKYGLAHNVGGSGSTCVVSIIKSDN